MNNRSDTAHIHWDKTWQSEEGREDWAIPEQDVVDSIPLMKERGFTNVLDLGCGIGRHALFLAEQGFKVHAMDGSSSGIDYLRTQAESLGLDIQTDLSEMTSLPYDDLSMDYILIWNVIYHGNLSVVYKSISEILRVLKPGGFVQGTMLSKRNHTIPVSNEISKNTYINKELSDKAHPHFYCSAGELVSLFDGFELWWLKDREHKKPGSFHWHFLAEKL